MSNSSSDELKKSAIAELMEETKRASLRAEVSYKYLPKEQTKIHFSCVEDRRFTGLEKAKTWKFKQELP